MSDTLRSALASALSTAVDEVVGHVVAVSAGVITARLPDARVGSCHAVETSEGALLAEVVGFDESGARLLPFGGMAGVRPGAAVRPSPVGDCAPSAVEVLGDVIDPLGVSLVNGRRYAAAGSPLVVAPPSPLTRTGIAEQLTTGVRAIDGLLPLGVGQRVGLFAGSGVGKSTLLAQLARGASADVCVVGLIGERGREVAEFVNDVLGPEGRARTTVVVATSDAPPMVRVRAAQVATALAEQWRAAGKHCLLLMDSLTRYARGLREAALLAGEVPARRGYPASVFAELPRLLERSGTGREGAITAIYTVLVAGGDMEEPVSDEVRGIVDGHWVLSRTLAERQHFPALDVPASVSRVAPRITSPSHQEWSSAVRRGLSLLAQHADAIDLGIYTPGSQPLLDRCVDARDRLDAFLRQGEAEYASLEAVLEGLDDLAYALDG